jgi:hypothetical protein
MARDIDDADLREDFHHIQIKLSKIISEDVSKRGGPYTNSEGCVRGI